MRGSRLDELLNGIRGKTIAVVGDMMLDRYFWGSVARISPEAPVPVVEVESESARLGGAANVAHNIKSLGGNALLVGVVGTDSSAELLRSILREQGFVADGLVADPSRPTTVKTRIIAHHQHVVRIDRESRTDVAPPHVDALAGFLRTSIGGIDAIILEDYNKGVVTTALIRVVTRLANENGRIITADPKFNNFFEYKNVTVFKPNTREVETALHTKLDSPEAVAATGKELLTRLDAKNVLITQGEKGMTLFERNGSSTHVPAKAREVADVSGAGDTVISTMTIALAAGASPKEACALANFAGGVVCGEVGVVPIDRDSLRAAALRDTNHVQPGGD